MASVMCLIFADTMAATFLKTVKMIKIMAGAVYIEQHYRLILVSVCCYFLFSSGSCCLGDSGSVSFKS